ncbi:RpiB/LacA/LacB family sugar-phosphate isomerase [Bifidobacterium sp. MA2]|uniref:RpiB/LacA/LacB family sugar-phosphate isomerase n=1 Tax=Bifidobacterium santillanense TaxID=2809028 RepID=A0ABS5UME3_9BIFI|nr:RpiB/LacA/LacB family sugar-phosphate isomerase [Bifidobacterium santillanense]MBT1172022.1 RpiB/LacA/LacB family sugar-phosphate isomerase [Bifidobacterium santillanense]
MNNERHVTRVVMAADPLGYDLKDIVKEHLTNRGIQVTDLTPDTPDDYFSVGETVGERIASGEFERGFVFCGTGMGVSIVANKFTGVYAALCESIETARLSRVINDANVLAMGGIILTPYLAKRMADVFLDTGFAHGFSEADPEFLTQALGHVRDTETRIAEYNASR